MLRRFSSAFLNNFATAGLFCLLLFFCANSWAVSADEKVQKATESFARNFSLFIQDGYTVGFERDGAHKDGDFIKGRFVFKPARGGEGQIEPVGFVLSPDGKILMVGAVGPLDPIYFKKSPVGEFRMVPGSVKNAPVLLVSKDGQIIAASRIMETGVDYAKKNRNTISLAGSPALGSKNAPVVIVEYSDFQCPYCRGVVETLHSISNEYKGKVKIVFKHLPLDFHKWAYQAAETSLCFRKHGGDNAFWYFHDEVFKNQETVTEENSRKRFSSLASGAGLDPKRVIRCLDSREMKKRVKKDIDEAKMLEVDGTPTFFVDGIRVNNPALLRKAVNLRLSTEGRN